VYPLSPALLNVLVALSGALQRERTGLKLLQELLFRRRDDLRLGQLIPLGDLWDVLVHGTGEAFTDRLRQESEAAKRFDLKARAYLEAKYGGDTDERFVADDRFVKTLLEAVGQQDSLGARRIWVKDRLWQAFGVKDAGQFACEREIVWRGTRRTVELVFADVRDPGDLSDAQFALSSADRVRDLSRRDGRREPDQGLAPAAGPARDPDLAAGRGAGGPVSEAPGFRPGRDPQNDHAR
jgi:hypothetical protein